VIIPISPIVTNIPAANIKDNLKLVLILTDPWVLIKPIISGILERWQGLRRMLNRPQVKAANRARPKLPCDASLSAEKRSTIMARF